MYKSMENTIRAMSSIVARASHSCIQEGRGGAGVVPDEKEIPQYRMKQWLNQKIVARKTVRENIDSCWIFQSELLYRFCKYQTGFGTKEQFKGPVMIMTRSQCRFILFHGNLAHRFHKLSSLSSAWGSTETFPARGTALPSLLVSMSCSIVLFCACCSSTKMRITLDEYININV